MFLPSIPTIVYTTKHQTGRQERASKMLNELGFTNWQFWFGSEGKKPYWANIHDDLIKILGLPAPFLFMEDDAVVTANFKPEIDYPADAQLVYLGGTTHGELRYVSAIRDATTEDIIVSRGTSFYPPGVMIYTERPDEYIRVYNMHSAHAILFVDDAIKNELRLVIDMNRGLPHDVILALSLFRYKAYCVKRPFWYQKDGHNDKPTLEYYNG